jgi:hypothetical protein
MSIPNYQQQTKIIKTNDGWLVFLTITMILLLTSFFTINFLRIKAQNFIDPLSERISKKILKTDYSDPLKAFEEKEMKKTKVKDSGYPEEKKDLKQLLADKRRLANLENEEVLVPLTENLGLENINTLDLEENDFQTKDLMGDSFFVVNHIFTYEQTFKSEDAGEATFLSGTKVYLFVEMYNLQEDSEGEIDIAIDFMLQDENRKIIPGYDTEDLVVFNGKPPYKEGYFLARMSIPLEADFKPGKYYTDILIRDKNSEVNRKEVWVLRIKEPTL